MYRFLLLPVLPIKSYPKKPLEKNLQSSIFTNITMTGLLDTVEASSIIVQIFKLFSIIFVNNSFLICVAMWSTIFTAVFRE